MFGTTKTFLDYFSLKKLEDLPPLADLSDWESLRVQLDLPEVDEPADSGEAMTGEQGDSAAYGDEDEQAQTVTEPPRLRVLSSDSESGSESEKRLRAPE
jgi:segregation and condensation protein B